MHEDDLTCHINVSYVTDCITYRAWRLLPRLAVDLHGEALLGLDDDRGTLRESLAR